MKLFTPGPVEVKPQILRAASESMLFHRAIGFEALYAECVQGLKKCFCTDDEYIFLILTGSGTMANEAVIHSLISDEETVLLLANGDFGSRLEVIMKLHGKKYTVLRKNHGEIFSRKEIERSIEQLKPSVVFAVALETSTGLVNPIYELGELSKEYQFELFVDAVSALGAEEIKIPEWNISAIVTVPNKAIEALPGLSIVCIKKDLLEKNKNNQKHNLYLDLVKNYEFSLKNQTPTTPAVNLFFALREALAELEIEGLAFRINRYKKLTTYLRKEIKALGLEIINLAYGTQHAANAITCVKLPRTVDARDLHSFLYTRNITLWYYQHKEVPVHDNVIQISVMGIRTKTEIDLLVKNIKKFLSIKDHA